MNKTQNANDRIKEFCRNWSYGTDDILLVRKMREGGLSPEQIVIALNTIENTCQYCWDGESNCQCWNDE